MVFKLICLYLAVTCVFAAPPTDVVPLEKQQPTVIPIISQSEELESNGTYKFSYETGNGIKREETSYDKVLPKAKSGPSSSEGGESSDESNEIHVQQGSYSYTAPDGTIVSVRYIADENGFRLIGDHLGKAPSVVPTISGGRRVKALAQDNAEVASAPSAIAVKPATIETSNAPEVPQTPEAPKAPEAAQSPDAPKAPQAPQSPAASKAPEVSQAPAIPQTPEAPKEQTLQAPNPPSVESSAGEISAEQVLTTESSPEKNSFEASSESSTTPESPATEATSTIEPISSTTEPATEVTSTGAPDQSTTTETGSTTEASSAPSTTEETSESVSTTPSEPSTPEESVSTPAEEPSTLAEEPSTPAEKSSTLTEEPSTPAASTVSSLDATTEVVTDPSV